MKAEGPRLASLTWCADRDGAYPGMYLEMRQWTARSQNQREWRTFLTEQGYLSIVCKGAAAAIREIWYVGLDMMRTCKVGGRQGNGRRKPDGAGDGAVTIRGTNGPSRRSRRKVRVER